MDERQAHQTNQQLDRDHRPTRCTATCADGSPCWAWAVHGTDPPRCAPHGGGESSVGAPKGNKNALTYGFYAHTDVPESGWTIDMLIADLSDKQAILSRYISQLFADEDADLKELMRPLRVHGMNASRLGRLHRDRLALRGTADEWYEKALNLSLDTLSEVLGVDL
jgi:hypothetical protein